MQILNGILGSVVAGALIVVMLAIAVGVMVCADRIHFTMETIITFFNPNQNSKGMKTNVIPPITDPQGSGWDQPSTDRIAITDKYATMSKETFGELLDYSRSQPTGCYPGKMWRTMDESATLIKDGEHKGKYRKGPDYGKWFLAWFGEHEDPKFCTNNYREIIISENL